MFLSMSTSRTRCTSPLSETESLSELRPVNTVVGAPDVPQKNQPFLVSLWHPVMLETIKISSACPDFILFTISVSSARSESHHYMPNTPQPNNTKSTCSILLRMEIGDIERMTEVQFEEKDGWLALKATASLPDIFARRVSRVPKLLPQYFFPHTTVALYCDLKRLEQIQKLDAYLLGKRLLAGTQLGIVQHPTSKGVVHEQESILKARDKHRPFIVDNVALLDAQVDLLSLMLSKTQQETFAIEGQIFARIISNISSANAFNSLWYEEYASGSDRDQIAFYGAAARMDLHRVSPFPCQVSNRSGVYVSRSKVDFAFAIHCDLLNILSSNSNDTTTN